MSFLEQYNRHQSWYVQHPCGSDVEIHCLACPAIYFLSSENSWLSLSHSRVAVAKNELPEWGATSIIVSKKGSQTLGLKWLSMLISIVNKHAVNYLLHFYVWWMCSSLCYSFTACRFHGISNKASSHVRTIQPGSQNCTTEPRPMTNLLTGLTLCVLCLLSLKRMLYFVASPVFIEYALKESLN